MKRREFVGGLVGAIAWPFVVRAQQPERMRRIVVIIPLAETDPEAPARAAALREGLHQLGWAEGLNVRTDYRWGVGDPERARAAVKGLLALSPDVIMPA